MHRVLLGKHDNSPRIKELEIISVFSTTGSFQSWTTIFWLHSVDSSLVQQGDVLELPTMSDGSVQRVKVRAAPVVDADDYTVTEPTAPNYGTTYGGLIAVTTDPVLIDGFPISSAQARNELDTKNIKLLTETQRQQSVDVGLYVSRPGANVLDPVNARTGNLAFDSSTYPMGSLRVLQTGTFQIQCKKTFMGKKGGLELLSDEQFRANADYTKLYPFEVPQSNGSFVEASPSNANTIMLGYKEGQEPITGNAFSHEFVQNVYCDYGTTTVEFNPPLPDNIKTPYISLHFAVANSSGHFHPWYANVTCIPGREDYEWQYANSQHCVHMDSAWFRGKWSLRERTVAPFGTNLNNDYDKIDPRVSNVHIGGSWGTWDASEIPTHQHASIPTDLGEDVSISFDARALLRGSTSDLPGRPFDKNYMSTDSEKIRWIDDNQLGINLPRYANPTMSVGAGKNWPPWRDGLGLLKYLIDIGYEEGPARALAEYAQQDDFYERNISTNPNSDRGDVGGYIRGGDSKETHESLLGLVDPLMFNAEAGSPGQSDLPNNVGAVYKKPGLPPEGAVKGSPIHPSKVSSTGVSHLRVKPPYYDPITGKPSDTLAGQGTPAQAISRPEDNGPQSYESSLSMNSPTSVWGGAFKSFAGMQGITYFANNTHLKIDAFMTPTHTPTPFETELVKTRVENPKANQFDWLGDNYLGDGTVPNQEFDEFGNIRKNVGIAVGKEDEPPKFKTEINYIKKELLRWADRDFGADDNSMTDSPRNYLSATQSLALDYSWSNVVYRAAAAGYGLDYKEQLPRKFRTKYWDGSQTEYEWWPLGHANGHFTIAYGTRSNPSYSNPGPSGSDAFINGGEILANTIQARGDEYDDRHHNQWNEWKEGAGAMYPAPTFLSESEYFGRDRSQLESQFLHESRDMNYDDEKLKIFRGHPVYMAACYGDYRPIAFIGSDTDSAGGARGINFVSDLDTLDVDFPGGEMASEGGLQLLGDTYVNQLANSTFGPQTHGNKQYPGGSDQLDEWSPFWPLLNKGTRFPNQLPDTEGKGYPPNSQYEPGDAFLKTRTFQGQPTSLDSFWNSFSNNMSQYVSANTPYGEFYYADGGYAMDFSPYFNYAGGSYLYSAEKVEQRIVSGSDTYRMMKLIPSDFNIQRQSLQKHNWNGGNPKAGVGTEGKRFGFGGAGSAQALGGEGEGVFDTYIGRYIVYAIEGGGADE